MEKYELTENEIKARERVALALDVSSGKEALELVRNLHDLIGLYKIGKELFTSEGPPLVKVVQKEGGDVFLDLKYHDIPNTVKGASRAATKLGVYMFNVHSPGGTDMMKAAVDGVEEAVGKYRVERPKVLGVTVLTSIDQRILNEELRVSGTVEEQVLHLAKLTDEAGLDGIVCSAADLYAVRGHMKEDFMYVTPGVKGPRTKAGVDQKRVFTPGNAIEDGSTILVIGRAIRDPQRTGKKVPYDVMRQAAYEILQDMAPHM